MATKIINGITYTHRTKRDGYPTRIVCTDAKFATDCPILALCLSQGEYEGYLTLRQDLTDRYDGCYDLLEGVEPEPDWSKVAIDTPVWVRNYKEDKWVRRHFAGLHGKKIMTFDSGKTSHTAKSSEESSWNMCSLTNPTQEVS